MKVSGFILQSRCLGLVYSWTTSEDSTQIRDTHGRAPCYLARASLLTVCLVHVADEEDPVFDPSWPHLQIVYELFLRFIVASDVDIRTLKKYINGQSRFSCRRAVYCTSG